MKDYTICAYMRLSNEDSDIFGRKVESSSITSQRKLIMDYINKQPEFKGCRVIERCDDGISGRHFDTRPQFMDMIEQTKKGKIQCIVVKDCSRFGRDYVELGDYLEQLFPFLGVRFIAINDHYDSDACEGGLDIAFKNLVYDIYAREASKKMRDTRRRLAEQGKYYASQTLYGYKKVKGDVHRLEVDPEAAAIVREIFDMRLAGMGTTEIAKNLNDRGIKCQTLYKYEKGEAVARKEGVFCWFASTVEHVLRNEIYTGAVVSLRYTLDAVTGKMKKKAKDEWVRVEGMHEAIISKEEFMRVQESFHYKNSPAAMRRVHYRCGICGKSLNRSNKTDLYCLRGYVLQDDSECRGVKVKEDILDDLVLRGLKEKLKRVMKEEQLRIKRNVKSASEADRIHALEGALESAKKAKEILYEKLAERSIDRESFKEKKQGYDEEIAGLEEQISDARMAERLAAEAGEDAREKVETAKSFLDLKEMSEEAWDKFVEEVRVFPDYRIEIRWKFGEA